jgi:hypothetical protein
MICTKVKKIPVHAYYRPIGFPEVEAPRFQENWLMKLEVCQPYAPASLPLRKYS